MRDAERIPMMLAALERAWRKDPDARLGQVMMVLLRRAHPNIPFEEEGKRLFNVEDGQLLQWIGPETDGERQYIALEPEEAREGWKRWMTAMREKQSEGDQE